MRASFCLLLLALVAGGASLCLLILALVGGGAKDTAPVIEGEPKDTAHVKEGEPAKLLFTFKPPGRESSRSVQFSPDGTRLAAAGWSEFVGVWDLKTGAELLKLTKTGNEWSCLAFSPDGKNLVLGDFHGIVKILDAADGKSLGTLHGHTGFVDMIAFLEDKNTLVTACSGGNVFFWDFSSRKRIANRELSLGEHAHAAITPDGKTLVSGRYAKDGMLLDIWDTVDRKKTATIDGGSRGVLSIAITPDGKTAFTSDQREEVGHIWDLTNKSLRGKLVGHEGAIFQYALTPDGETAVTGGSESVKLWDTATGGERLTLKGRGGIVCVAVSADSNLVAAGRGESINVWRLAKNANAFPGQPAKAPAKRPQKVPDDGLPDREMALIIEQAEQLATQGAKGALALAEKVRGASPKWKYAALRNLLRLGPDAAPALDAVVQELRDQDSEHKSICIEILTGIGPKAKTALPAIIAAAKDTRDLSGSVRNAGPSNTAEAALLAVKAIDPDSMPRLAESVLPSLLKVMEGGREGPMRSALALLGQLGPHAKPALPKLRDSIAEMPRSLLRDVFPVFLAVGEDGVAILADYMLDPKTSSETRLALMSGYRWGRTSTPSTDRILRALLKDKSPEVRVSALQSLEWVSSKELVPDLIPLLNDFDILKVRSDFRGDDSYHAARALGKQGEPAVPHLIKALEHEVPLARYQAAYALAKIGKDAIKARSALEPLLNDKVELIQLQAAKALLAQGKPHEQALAKIAWHLRSDDKLLGEALDAARSLGSAGRALFPAVKKLTLEATSFSVQRQGFDTLRHLGGDGKELVEVWTKLAQENPTLT